MGRKHRRNLECLGKKGMDGSIGNVATREVDVELEEPCEESHSDGDGELDVELEATLGRDILGCFSWGAAVSAGR